MGGAVAIMFALRAHGKAAEAAGAANGMKALLASREQFMDVGLMAYVPDEFILGRAENVVQGEGQLDDAKIGPEMAAVFGQNVDQLLPDLLGQLLKLRQS